MGLIEPEETQALPGGATADWSSCRQLTNALRQVLHTAGFDKGQDVFVRLYLPCLIRRQKAIDCFRRGGLVLICAQTNRIALVQTDPGAIQPCAVLSDDASNELMTRSHCTLSVFHYAMNS